MDAIPDTIRHAIARACSSIGVVVAAVDVVMERPADIAHGDYSTNVALKCAKETKMSPRAFAESIVAKLDPIAGVSKVEVAGPGFINFTLAPEALSHIVDEARSDENWGRNQSLAREEILLEYTSPNLFKPLHIGNLVGNIVGESLARLMENAGAAVRRINYPSDIGLTVAKGVWGMQKIGADPHDINALGEAYRVGNTAYENDSQAKFDIERINKALYEESDPALNALRIFGTKTSLRHLDDICKKLGTVFDAEFYESQASPIGKEIVMAHSTDGIFQKSDGAIVFPESQSGLHTRVFVNSAGLTTYEAKDLGNFELKQRMYPHWTRSYVVTGGEQMEYFKVIIAAIRRVFPDTLHKQIAHIPTGFLTLTTGKMSSRLGNVLTGESLIEDLRTSAQVRAAKSRAPDVSVLADAIAVAALKYEVLKQTNGKNIVFDKEKALSLEGDSGPYLQYTQARARAVVRRVQEQGRPVSSASPSQTASFRDPIHEVHSDSSQAMLQKQDAPAPALARILIHFPEIVARATNELQPHLITHYLVELAGAFNSWYGQEQIIDGSPAESQKVALTEAVQKTLAKGLWLLGIPAPEQM